MYSVLLVDDVKLSLNELRSMNVWGEVSDFYITGEAANGRDALKMLYEKPVDMVITDIRMPVVDGIELTKKVLEDKLTKCVVLMSQFSDFEYARQGFVSGAIEYLLKPINEDDFLKMLRQAASYIKQKSLEQTSIEYLKNILEENAQEHFPANELRKLAASIADGNGQSTVIATKMLEATWAGVNYNSLKTAYIFNNVIAKLSDAVIRDFPWIQKLSRITELSAVDLSEYHELSDIKAKFLEIVDNLTTVIRKFELDVDNNVMIKNACKIILDNIDTEISLSRIAKKLFISRSYLSMLFREKTGQNVIDYITYVKIERAKILLSDRNLKNYEIAAILGYCDEYFTKLFKKVVGMTPTTYRKRYIEVQ
jgi:two-component system response regulator YesN